MKTILLSALLMFLYSGKRQILLFYNINGISVKDKQISALNKDKKGLEERDIVIHVYKTDETIAGKWKVRSGAAFTFILVW